MVSTWLLILKIRIALEHFTYLRFTIEADILTVLFPPPFF